MELVAAVDAALVLLEVREDMCSPSAVLIDLVREELDQPDADPSDPLRNPPKPSGEPSVARELASDEERPVGGSAAELLARRAHAIEGLKRARV